MPWLRQSMRTHVALQGGRLLPAQRPLKIAQVYLGRQVKGVVYYQACGKSAQLPELHAFHLDNFVPINGRRSSERRDNGYETNDE